MMLLGIALLVVGIAVVLFGLALWILGPLTEQERLDDDDD